MANIALAERQQQVLDAIRTYIRAHGHPLSMRELGPMVGVASTSTVPSHLEALERKGAITRTRGKVRSIVIVGDAAVNALTDEHLVQLERLTEATRDGGMVQVAVEIMRRVLAALRSGQGHAAKTGGAHGI